MALSDNLEKKVLDHTFGVTALTAPSSFEIAVATSAFAEDGTANSNEKTTNTGSGNYERQSISFSAASTNSSNKGEISNSAQITFPEAPSNLGDISHWAIYATVAGTANTLVACGSFTTARTVNSGDQLAIAAGALKITAD